MCILISYSTAFLYFFIVNYSLLKAADIVNAKEKA